MFNVTSHWEMLTEFQSTYHYPNYQNGRKPIAAKEVSRQRYLPVLLVRWELLDPFQSNALALERTKVTCRFWVDNTSMVLSLSWQPSEFYNHLCCDLWACPQRVGDYLDCVTWDKMSQQVWVAPFPKLWCCDAALCKRTV